MTPKNFPGRKNDRRIAALKRLGKLNGGTPPGRTHGLSVQANIKALADRVVPPEQARAIRTKKDRRDRAKLRAA